MSKHRRTKSNGNYFTQPEATLLPPDPPVQPVNETQAIIQNIQKSSVHQEQIVEKLEEPQTGLYNGLFHFGKGQAKRNHDLNLSIISECSSTPSVNQEPQTAQRSTLHRKCGSYLPAQKSRSKVHAHSQSLQLTIQNLEQEIQFMKVQQLEMQNINKFLIREIHQSRQDYYLSQQKNEAILQRVAYLEKMLALQMSKEGSTSDSIDFPFDDF